LQDLAKLILSQNERRILVLSAMTGDDVDANAQTNGHPQTAEMPPGMGLFETKRYKNYAVVTFL
jgi:hypothetical protein